MSHSQSLRNSQAYLQDPADSAPTRVDLPAAVIRHLHDDILIAELADLEDRIRLLESEDDDSRVGQATMQDLVEAEFTILRELRRRQERLQRGLSVSSFRPRKKSKTHVMGLVSAGSIVAALQRRRWNG